MSFLDKEPLVSIVIPVYNRKKYLIQAIESVLNQTYKNFELVIADDNSQESTKDFLSNYSLSSKIIITYNSQNIGLFPNINKAIRICKGSYIFILCSDDFLLPECLEISMNLACQYPEAGLILSPNQRVDSENKTIAQDHNFFYNQLKLETRVWLPEESIPLLAKYGSINGSLTGFFFKKELYKKVGDFKEDWQHASDWEWLYRALKSAPSVISTTPTAVMRLHSEQLSGVNFRNICGSLEFIEMVGILLADPYIHNIADSTDWASNLLQFQLWFALKFALQGRWMAAITIAKAIHKVRGIGSTLGALLKWLPQRWRVYRQKNILAQSN